MKTNVDGIEGLEIAMRWHTRDKWFCDDLKGKDEVFNVSQGIISI
jgi:hypothetical protein